MKKILGILAIALLAMYSCSDEEETVVETFSYKFDGVEVEASLSNNFYYSQSYLDDSYYIYALMDDSNSVYIDIPELEVGSWNSTNDSTDAGITIYGDDYYADIFGNSGDYTIEITSLGSDGTLKGTFSGSLGYYEGYTVKYVDITEGEFVIKKGY